MRIQPYAPFHLDAILRFSIEAWTPVFEAVEEAMTSEIFRAQHQDWRADQRRAIAAVCADEEVRVWVATEGDRPVGFVAAKRHEDDEMGEIYMIAVDPEFQRRGIAAALIDHSLAWLKEAGMTTAMVETGADPGHDSARRTYEDRGFLLVPVARYFKKL